MTDETALIQNAQAGDQDAMLEMISRYMPLVWKLARKRATKWARCLGVDLEDLVQEGMIALWQRVKTFDFSRGVTFMTYAYPCIDGTIRKCAGRGGLIYADHRRMRICDAGKEAKRRIRSIASLDHGNTEDGRGLAELVTDREDALADYVEREHLEWALSHMPTRQQEILRLRQRGMNDADIGRSLGITRERVGQLMEPAVFKLSVFLRLGLLV